MPVTLIALMVFVLVALAVFAAVSLLDQRSAQSRLIKERLANERKAPERAPEEELALLRDEQLSKIPALDTLLRRSTRVTNIQKMLAQGGMSMRAGNFLGFSALAGVVATIAAYVLSKRVEVAWVALLLGFLLPYSYASFRRNQRFEKFEELFPEAIDTLARAVRAGHAFTTALEMITAEVAEPVSGEFRQLYEEQKFGMPVRDALINLTERMPPVSYTHLDVYKRQDNEQRAMLQVLVDGTNVARTVHACASFPVAASDPVTRRVRAANPDVTLVDIPTDNPPLALRAIELLHQEMPDAAIFAIGNLNQPQVIVNAMRVGAREFIERPTTTTDLLEAFVRLTTAQRRGRQEGIRGKVFLVINAKGGNGATTVAVNLALGLHSASGQTALVDLAPLGHAALHMNLKPVFNVADATRNLYRMDASLLESFMTRHSGGLQLLAGTNLPAAAEPTTAEFVRLFDMLVTHFRYVVVDASSRFDAVSRLIASLSETVLDVYKRQPYADQESYDCSFTFHRYQR